MCSISSSFSSGNEGRFIPFADRYSQAGRLISEWYLPAFWVEEASCLADRSPRIRTYGFPGQPCDLPCSAFTGLRHRWLPRLWNWAYYQPSCSSAPGFALRLPSDQTSRFSPCLRLGVAIELPLRVNTSRGLSPHKRTSMSGVQKFST